MRRLPVLAAALCLAATSALSDVNDFDEVTRGRYLYRLGDCAACHTAEGEAAMAGGLALDTPFGTIWSSNLTPDAQTGIGDWDREAFWRAMNEGKGKDGSRLYPAFPYTHFTLITREDSDAIFAYLRTLDPVSKDVPQPDFPFPLNRRVMLATWNLLNFDDRTFRSDPEKSPEWNRGRYIVEGLGHCGMCHSPKNVLGAEKPSAALSGGYAEGWFAPSLTGAKRDGIGNWSEDDIVDYLLRGRNARTAAFGPMADVIEHSTSHLTEADARSIAVYLRSRRPTDEQWTRENAEAERPDEQVMTLGRLIYDTQCSACHAAEGAGVEGAFATLAGSSLAQARDPSTMLRAILHGVRAAATDEVPTPHAMPSFDWKLNDAQVAAVATYVRNAFGNAAGAVEAGDVAGLR